MNANADFERQPFYPYTEINIQMYCTWVYGVRRVQGLQNGILNAFYSPCLSLSFFSLYLYIRTYKHVVYIQHLYHEVVSWLSKETERKEETIESIQREKCVYTYTHKVQSTQFLVRCPSFSGREKDLEPGQQESIILILIRFYTYCSLIVARE